MALVRTPTIDSRGRHTHVWRSEAATSGSGRNLSSLGAPPQPPSELELRAIADQTREHITEIVEESGMDTSRVLAVIEQFWGLYGTPEVGRTRAVFDRGDGTVAKVAINDEGYAANSFEVRASAEPEKYLPVAKSEFLDVDDYCSVVIAERVEIVIARRSELPDWTDFIDGAQVGYNSAGELVAYDL